MIKKETKDLEIHYVDIETIKEAEYNPRKISPKKKKELIESIEKYGIRDALKINKYKGRENVLISGHQRLKIAKKLGYKKVPVTYEYLDLANEKEMNLRWNKNGGDFDLLKVQDVADRDLLLTIGFMEKELNSVLTDFEQKFEDVNTDDPVYPITPKFNEKYDYVMILTSTEMDFNWLSNILELETSKDYKSSTIGLSRVINVSKFQNLFKQWQKNKSK